MKKRLIKVLGGLLTLYITLCVILYLFQESLIFLPQKLPSDHKFSFHQDFEELNFITSDGKSLNGLLFKVENSKGLVFYLHGNAGSLYSWGNVATTYTDLGYDTFILDYRGYGKSQGEIYSQAQLFDDNQLVYDALAKRYNEKSITIIGYSIGTGMAAKLASDNNPEQLILQAPYYSLSDMMRRRFPVIPTFLLKYKLPTNEFLSKSKVPISIFHGDNDYVIPYESSLKLTKELNLELVTLQGQGHNGITYNPTYQRKLRRLLN